MCRKLIYLISFMVLLGLATSSVSVGALIQDDFEADTLDLSKWQVLSGPDVSITQAGGQVLFDRPQAQLSYLVTTEQYDPAVTPLTITGSAVTDPEGLAIWTRASNIGNTAASAQHVLDSGIRIPLWPAGQANGWYDGEIIEKTAGTWPWSGLTTGNMPGEEAYDWDFVVTDDGTTITATFTQSSDPNNTFTLTAECTTDFDTDYIAITVVNGYLNDISISAAEPQVGLVVTNGTFDGAEPAALDIPDWYDLDVMVPTGEADWWNTASICGAPNPFPDGSAFMGDHLWGGTPGGNRWLYQQIGTKEEGVNYTISFDYAQPTDGSEDRSVAIQVDIYQGSFDGAAQDVDIADQGLTLIDSLASPYESAMVIHSFTSALDLSSANTTDPLWLRISNLGAETGAFVCIDNVQITSSAEPETKNIIWVSFHEADDAPSVGAAGEGFTEAPDKGYTDLLTANGYNVTRYLTSATPDPEVLNAADLVIVSRSVASGGYQNDGATAWNNISAPMIITSAWTLRSSRMGYTTGTTMEDITGDITLTVSDPTHPIFEGIALTDGTMDNPFTGLVVYPTDGTTVALGTSINTDPVNPEGTVLATISEAGNGPVGGMVIGEWQAGATLTHSGGAEMDVLAGHRLVFLTGSREPSGINSETAGMYDLLPDGEQMLLNAVKYMIPVKPVDPGTNGLVAAYSLEGDATDASGNGLDGVIMGDPNFIEGVAGMAMDLDGDGDYVDCGNDPIIDAISEISVSAWLNIRAINTAWQGAVVKGENAWRLGNVNLDPRFHFGITIWNAPDTASVDGAIEVGFDEWHHVIGMFDGANISVYLDGVLDTSVPTTEPIGISTTNMFIGDNSEATGRYWDGLIDEVMIYNRALSEEEILFLAGQ
jgi:hypothetical protein